MKFLNRNVAIGIASLFIFGSQVRGAEESDLKRFQGTWVGVIVGQEDEGKVTMTFEKEKVEFQRENSQEWYKGEIELGGKDEKPKKLYATIKDCPVKEFIDKVCNGIYKVDDNTLMITASAPGSDHEPKDFDDDQCQTVMLKRKP